MNRPRKAPVVFGESSSLSDSHLAGRFAELTAGLEVELVLWSFPNDVGAGINPAFEFLSLRPHDGQAKPALRAWQELAGVE